MWSYRKNIGILATGGKMAGLIFEELTGVEIVPFVTNLFNKFGGSSGALAKQANLPETALGDNGQITQILLTFMVGQTRELLETGIAMAITAMVGGIILLLLGGFVFHYKMANRCSTAK
jgi:hypothetical protein